MKSRVLVQVEAIMAGAFVAYLAIVSAVLGNFTEKKGGRMKRASLFHVAGYVGIALTLLYWLTVKIDYSFTGDAAGKFRGEFFAQAIITLGGIIGSTLVVQGLRMHSDSKNKE